MNENMNSLHFWVGAATGVIVFSLSLMQLWGSDVLIVSISLQALILACLVITSLQPIERNFPQLSHFALWLMLPLMFILVWFVRIDYFFIYTIVWISIAVHYRSQRECWFWLLIISIAWYLVRAFSWQHESALFEVLLVGSFHLFALVSSATAKRAALANEQTQLLNRELLTTQHLLGEVSKEHERNRIARDLHDLLGHHLTALAINLQVASRISDGEVKGKIEHCHALSKLLLSDVRDAVSTLRDAPAVDLRELLSLAVKDIPRMKVSLEIDDTLRVDDVQLAETVLRCVQEAITNSLRHSSANKLSIKINEIDNNLSLRIQDDGRTMQTIETGNGLKGMRERIDLLKGNLTIDNTDGFLIDAVIPLAANS